MNVKELDEARFKEASKFGRIDQEGRVFVQLGTGEKNVGQYSTGEIDKTMDLYIRRFVDFEEKLDIFEQRLKSDTVSLTAPAIDIAMNNFKSFLQMKNAVGDFSKIEKRVEELAKLGEERKEQNRIQRKAQIEEALKTLNTCVTNVESVISGDLERVNWKHASDVLDQNFDKWKEVRGNLRLPEKQADELWTRFKVARDVIINNRREFQRKFRDNAKRVKSRKQVIIDEANKIKESENFDVTKKTFQRLLKTWKEIGRGGRKDDDKQWAQFKAAQDYFYSRLPKKEFTPKAERPKWDNDLSEMKADITGLDALAALKEKLSK
ncbi:MAG: DUF349 domain-containing protein [Candidatus Ancillula sp.]|jgi:hypothetical protein|nr:DUF349 domain-containing protein [Candidatus Ancillula sp.]